MKTLFLLIGSSVAIKFIGLTTLEERKQIESLSNLMVNRDINEEGWSSTRGLKQLDSEDFSNEFGQNSHVL